MPKIKITLKTDDGAKQKLGPFKLDRPLGIPNSSDLETSLQRYILAHLDRETLSGKSVSIKTSRDELKIMLKRLRNPSRYPSPRPYEISASLEPLELSPVSNKSLSGQVSSHARILYGLPTIPEQDETETDTDEAGREQEARTSHGSQSPLSTFDMPGDPQPPVPMNDKDIYLVDPPLPPAIFEEETGEIPSRTPSPVAGAGDPTE